VSGFAQDAAQRLQVSVDRMQLPDAIAQPAYGRAYRNEQFYGFAQASLKLSRRLGANAGIRFEYFGPTSNTGTPDPYLRLAEGRTIEERIAGAALLPGDAAHRALHRSDHNNWAPRVGLFYDLSGDWRTVFRASFGVFYDRPFENLTISTRNNSLELVEITNPAGYPDVSQALRSATAPLRFGVPRALWVDGALRTPYVQSWFGGVQHQFSRALYGEVSAQGASARKLISTDIVNRRYAGTADPEGRLNANIPRDIFFRSNAASSSYSALTALARYAGRRLLFQAAYTWSHSIDNQSDPLQGTFDDLQFSRSSNVNRGFNAAAFTQEFDARADRASSDFDQRQNVVALAVWRSGLQTGKAWRRLLISDWQVAGMAATRSGFPFNIIAGAPASQEPAAHVAELHRPRPNLVPGRSPFLPDRVPVPGGYRILDPAAFASPPLGVLGALGRNALVGPGFWNLDLSIARSFRPRGFGEARSIQARADFFNALNHANLGNPDGLMGSGTFGVARIGRQGVQPSFPSVSPLDQLARQIHFQLKVLF
jgi:hypothetical protein